MLVVIDLSSCEQLSIFSTISLPFLTTPASRGILPFITSSSNSITHLFFRIALAWSHNLCSVISNSSSALYSLCIHFLYPLTDTPFTLTVIGLSHNLASAAESCGKSSRYKLKSSTIANSLTPPNSQAKCY